MLCPVCKVDLVMTDRQGIEIDYCPKCRGVFLDRGELDKLIELSNSASSRHEERHEDRREEYRPQREEHRREYDDRGSHHHKKKRGGLLGDLFEFGD